MNSSAIMGKKILVIDDEPGIRQILEIHLSAAGYDVVSAENARFGLERVSGGDIDMAVCDFKLPDMEGEEIVDAIREIDGDLPLVIISGFIDHEVAERVGERGRIEYLKKPFTKETLLAVVDRVLSLGGEPTGNG